MPTSLRTIAAAACGGLLVAAAALTVRPTPVLGAPAADPADPPHTITVSAVGRVTLVPDVARVSLGISVTKPTVEAARAEAARVMDAIVRAAKSKGVAERDIRTTSISLSPQYAPNCGYLPTSSSPCAKPTAIVGYTMSEQVQVTVRDLDAAGGIVDAATAASATNVNGISFEVDDPARAETDARTSAIRAAHDKADAMARAAGVSLGAVVSISETSSPIPYPVPYAVDGGARADVATPVQPGTQDVQASVTVVYAIG